MYLKGLCLAIYALPVLLFCNAAYAQPVIDTLEGTEIRRSRILATTTDSKLDHYAPGMKRVVFDSALIERYRQQSAAVLLAQQVPVFIKSYGFNNLATLQFRGASAAQSMVVWNGVPLQNAALGITDLSLLPVMLADDLQVAYGGSAALLGSGNVGGALLLNSSPKGDSTLRQVEGLLGAGSFSQFQYGARLRYNVGRLRTQTRFFGQRAENNFPFIARNGTKQRLPNAALSGWTAAADADYKLNKKNAISLHGWLQHYQRAIPPALFQNTSSQNLEDASARISAGWNHTGRHVWYTRTAWLRDVLRYEDASINLNTSSIVNTLFGEAGWEKAIGSRQRLLIFTPVQYSRLDGLSDEYTQRRAALAASHTTALLSKRSLIVSLNMRAEAVDKNSYLSTLR